jgi:hypothetical protein
MTDLHGKRKFAGPTIQEKRRLGVGKEVPTEKRPPHLRRRAWVLTVEWTETRHYRGTEKFTSRAARDEAKRIIAREIERERKRDKNRYLGRYYSDDHAYLKGLARIEAVTRIKDEPVYTESIDESP